MNAEILKSKWAELSGKVIHNEFKSLRISPDCIPDIFIGVNKSSNRCLILAIPKNHKIDFKSILRENLTITFYKETNYIVLQLTENQFYDLFNDLIISLYQRIKYISDVSDYSKEFIQTFHKWSEFFVDKKTDGLSTDIIKGLFGELVVLRSLVTESGMHDINDILDSWKGPYDRGHDFELNQKDIEVKTKDLLKPDITISSEFQLEANPGKNLELLVVAVEHDAINGISLKDLAFQIKRLITDKLGDSSIFLKALRQKGLSFKNLEEYDHIRFRLIHEDTYECLNPAFPKLINSQLPSELNSLIYNIRLGSLVQFIIQHKDYQNGN